MTELFECVNCGRRSFYEKRRCHDCGAEEFTTVPADEGELLAVTTVHVTPDGVDEPNVLGFASFAGGANVIARIDDDLAVGDPVTLTAERNLRVSDDGTIRGGRLVAPE